MNSYHQVQYGERYWKILLGHWFRRYVEVLINRFYTLNDCIREYKPSSVSICLNDDVHLTPNNSSEAILLFGNSCWNSILFARLIKHINVEALEIKNYYISDINSKIKPVPTLNYGAGRRLLRKSAQYLRIFLEHISGKTDAVIFSSYLPRLSEIILHLSLRQVPQQMIEQPIKKRRTYPDKNLRNKLKSEMVKGHEEDIDLVLKELLFDLIPICYLEDYISIGNIARSRPWPSKPKFIFTSNNFDTDELFKFWAAEKIEEGVPYIVGQHGNNYGTDRYMNPSIEEITADKFITWGWKGSLQQHVRGFILKGGKNIGESYNGLGGLLLIENSPCQMMNTWDAVWEREIYFKEQFDFVDNLNQEIRSKMVVRLHSWFRKLNSGDDIRWRNYDASVQLENGECKLHKLISKSRLVVHSYDSTGLLETLSKNIPCIAFWQNEFNHLREEAKIHYRFLVDVGILHLTPSSAAFHVNSVWGNIEQWWLSTKVQEARVQFCEQYARVSDSPVLELKNLILRDAKEKQQSSWIL
jgi:putative transferase (TIGR04331 family)